MRVVIDTNIWISYLIGSLLQEIDERIVLKEIKIVVSEELLKELAEVSSRPKFKNIFTSKRIKELFSLLDNYAIVIITTTTFSFADTTCCDELNK
jgi:putative PIN family toxin of toxin-antitoxin system